MNTPDQPDAEQRRAEYQRLFTAAADALPAAIRTGVTDGGETVTHLLAVVAANLGGIDALTAARPGSWEAHHVDQILAATVGAEGEYLLEYRTAPIEVVECLDLVEVDAGLPDVYDDSLALIEEYETSATVDDPTDEAALDRVDAASELLKKLHRADLDQYAREFERHVHAAAADLVSTRHLPPDVPVTVRWVDWQHSDQTTGEQQAWGTLEHQLWEAAHTRTPPPGFAEPFDPSVRHPVAELRAAGRLPHQRIPELARYHHLTGRVEHGDDGEVVP
jgi:hypothetical protein